MIPTSTANTADPAACDGRLAAERFMGDAERNRSSLFAGLRLGRGCGVSCLTGTISLHFRYAPSVANTFGRIQ
jgi:hypothetical protein